MKPLFLWLFLFFLLLIFSMSLIYFFFRYGEHLLCEVFKSLVRRSRVSGLGLNDQLHRYTLSREGRVREPKSRHVAILHQRFTCQVSVGEAATSHYCLCVIESERLLVKIAEQVKRHEAKLPYF